MQRRHSYLIKLVQVRRTNGQEFHPFEQRQLGTRRKRQHPIVEVEPTQLSIDEPCVDKSTVTRDIVCRSSALMISLFGH